MIGMALNGEGEPRPTLLQVATQAALVELFTQWQTYANGVHWDYDSFRSVDFRAIAVAVLTAAGVEVKADEVPDTSKLRKLLAEPSVFTPTAAESTRDLGDSSRPYNLPADAVAEHGEQVQG
jgi:hypothetical protein